MGRPWAIALFVGRHDRGTSRYHHRPWTSQRVHGEKSNTKHGWRLPMLSHARWMSYGYWSIATWWLFHSYISPTIPENLLVGEAQLPQSHDWIVWFFQPQTSSCHWLGPWIPRALGINTSATVSSHGEATTNGHQGYDSRSHLPMRLCHGVLYVFVHSKIKGRRLMRF